MLSNQFRNMKIMDTIIWYQTIDNSHDLPQTKTFSGFLFWWDILFVRSTSVGRTNAFVWPCYPGNGQSPQGRDTDTPSPPIYVIYSENNLPKKQACYAKHIHIRSSRALSPNNIHQCVCYMLHFVYKCRYLCNWEFGRRLHKFGEKQNFILFLIYLINHHSCEHFHAQSQYFLSSTKICVYVSQIICQIAVILIDRLEKLGKYDNFRLGEGACSRRYNKSKTTLLHEISLVYTTCQYILPMGCCGDIKGDILNDIQFAQYILETPQKYTQH